MSRPLPALCRVQRVLRGSITSVRQTAQGGPSTKAQDGEQKSNHAPFKPPRLSSPGHGGGVRRGSLTSHLCHLALLSSHGSFIYFSIKHDPVSGYLLMAGKREIQNRQAGVSQAQRRIAGPANKHPLIIRPAMRQRSYHWTKSVFLLLFSQSAKNSRNPAHGLDPKIRDKNRDEMSEVRCRLGYSDFKPRIETFEPEPFESFAGWSCAHPAPHQLQELAQTLFRNRTEMAF